MRGPASEAPQTVATEKVINFVMGPIIFTFGRCKWDHFQEAIKAPAAPPIKEQQRGNHAAGKQKSTCWQNRKPRRRQTVSHLPARDEEIESEEIESQEIESQEIDSE